MIYDKVKYSKSYISSYLEILTQLLYVVYLCLLNDKYSSFEGN